LNGKSDLTTDYYEKNRFCLYSYYDIFSIRFTCSNHAENIAKTPLWMFHGSDDKINAPDMTARVYNRLVEIGAKQMRYTNYPGYGHEIWDKAQSEPDFYDWMFQYTKPKK
jgi:predicted peptidase